MFGNLELEGSKETCNGWQFSSQIYNVLHNEIIFKENKITVLFTFYGVNKISGLFLFDMLNSFDLQKKRKIGYTRCRFTFQGD